MTIERDNRQFIIKQSLIPSPQVLPKQNMWDIRRHMPRPESVRMVRKRGK
jgi:hypothetical protein